MAASGGRSARPATRSAISSQWIRLAVCYCSDIILLADHAISPSWNPPEALWQGVTCWNVKVEKNGEFAGFSFGGQAYLENKKAELPRQNLLSSRI